jgi:hypothetical protein
MLTFISVLCWFSDQVHICSGIMECSGSHLTFLCVSGLDWLLNSSGTDRFLICAHGRLYIGSSRLSFGGVMCYVMVGPHLWIFFTST